MNCESCGNDHDGTFASGRFCSRSCANSFSTKSKRSEINKTVSIKNKEKLSNGVGVGFCKPFAPKTVVIACLVCQTEFETGRPGLKGSSKFCSLECKHEQSSKDRKGKCGGFRAGAGRGVHCTYTSPIAGRVALQSTWELAYAKYLDSINANWRRSYVRFPYLDANNQTKNFIPDFYLIDEDLYVEVKGFLRVNEELKWKHFPKSLRLLFKQDLLDLGIDLK